MRFDARNLETAPVQSSLWATSLLDIELIPPGRGNPRVQRSSARLCWEQLVGLVQRPGSY